MTMSAAAVFASDGAMTLGTDTRLTGAAGGAAADGPAEKDPAFEGELRRMLDQDAAADERAAPPAGPSGTGDSPPAAPETANVAEHPKAPELPAAADQRADAPDLRADIESPEPADRTTGEAESRPAAAPPPASAEDTDPATELSVSNTGTPSSPSPATGSAARRSDRAFPDEIAVPAPPSSPDAHRSGSEQPHLSTAGQDRAAQSTDASDDDRATDETGEPDDASDDTLIERMAPFFADGALGKAPLDPPPPPLADPIGATPLRPPGARSLDRTGSAARSSLDERFSEPSGDNPLRDPTSMPVPPAAYGTQGLSSRIAAALSHTLDEGRSRARMGAAGPHEQALSSREPDESTQGPTSPLPATPVAWETRSRPRAGAQAASFASPRGASSPASGAMTPLDSSATGPLDDSATRSPAAPAARPPGPARTATLPSFAAVRPPAGAEDGTSTDNQARPAPPVPRWTGEPSPAASRAQPPSPSAYSRPSAAGSASLDGPRGPGAGDASSRWTGTFTTPMPESHNTYSMPRSGAAPSTPRSGGTRLSAGPVPPDRGAPPAGGFGPPAPTPRDHGAPPAGGFGPPAPTPRDHGASDSAFPTTPRSPGAPSPEPDPSRADARVAAPSPGAPRRPTSSVSTATFPAVRGQPLTPGSPLPDPARAPGSAAASAPVDPARRPTSASTTGTFQSRPHPSDSARAAATEASGSAATTGTFTAARARALDPGARRQPTIDSPPPFDPAPDPAQDSAKAAFQAARAALAQSPILPSPVQGGSHPRPNLTPDSSAAARRAASTGTFASSETHRTPRAPASASPEARDPAPASPSAGRDASADSTPDTSISAASGWTPDTRRDPLTADRAATRHSDTAPLDDAATPRSPLSAARDDTPAPPATSHLAAPDSPPDPTPFHVTLPHASAPGHHASAASAMSATTARLQERLGDRRQRIAAGIRGTSLPREARAEADIPDLGRIAVEARPRGAEVDVHVTAHKTEAARVIQEAAPSLESHLRNASVPLGHLSVSDHTAGNPQDNPHHSPTPQDPGDSPQDPKTPTPPTGRPRVRIIL